MVQIREEEHCSFVQSREGTLADLASPIMLVYPITRTEYHTDHEYYIYINTSVRIKYINT